MTVTHGSHAIHMIPLPENGNFFETWKKEDLIMQVLHSQTDRYGLRVKKLIEDYKGGGRLPLFKNRLFVQC